MPTPGCESALSIEQGEDKLLPVRAADATFCQAIVRSVLYLAKCSHHNICYSINQLTRVCSKLGGVNMTIAEHLFW